MRLKRSMSSMRKEKNRAFGEHKNTVASVVFITGVFTYTFFILRNYLLAEKLLTHGFHVHTSNQLCMHTLQCLSISTFMNYS